MKRLCTVGFILLSMSVVNLVFADAPWEITVVDSDSGAGQHCSLAVINGQPAIAYRYDDARSSLRYARFNGSVWVTTTVEESPIEYSTYVEYISLAQMPDGNPAIAFFDYVTSDLRFLRYDGSTWNSTVIDSTGDPGYFASLCVINGQPAISYLDDNQDLKYARYNGTTWDKTVVDTAASYTTDGRTSLKAQSNGYPAIAYYASKLKYAAFDGTTWNLSTVDNTSGTGRSASLAFGPDGKPAISYFYATNKKLMYASFDGTTWGTQAIFTGNSQQTSMYDSLAFLPNGVPILSWYQKYASNYARLNFSWLDNGQWNQSEVDGQYFLENKGMYASLAILNDYSLGIAYYDSRNYQLDFAKTAYPISATDPNIHYTATAWLAITGEEMVGIDESVYYHHPTGSVEGCGEALSSVQLENPMPGSYIGQITLNGQTCFDGECREWDQETGDCLLWGKCLARDEEWNCLEWVEPEIIDPNDASGRIQIQIQIDPTAVMPLGTEVFLHIQLDTTIEDPGASESRYCKIYHNSTLVEELTSDTEMYIPAVVGDIFDIDMYCLVESDGYYRTEMAFLFNIANEEGVIFQPNPDICGDGTIGPDDSVNLFDFNCLAAEWLATPCEAEGWCNNADIDRSGDVGMGDLLEMANHWLE